MLTKTIISMLTRLHTRRLANRNTRGLLLAAIVMISFSLHGCSQAVNQQSAEGAKEEFMIILHEKSLEYAGKTYEILEVDGGSLSGERLANVAVDIGFGDRVYWALTNEYGQLVYVIADKIILQDEEKEAVTADGRYYSDEAKVPGIERKEYDEGHVIADSLGGVSNAYNITPQNSILNRHGTQAYLEKVIRDAGGCEQMLVTISYPDTRTQIPSRYRYEYILQGNEVVDEFDNVDPDKGNIENHKGKNPENSKAQSSENRKAKHSEDADTDKPSSASQKEAEELAKVDTNGNGIVTIAEAKAAGYDMPIDSKHWLYKYMKDNDGDGMVGE